MSVLFCVISVSKDEVSDLIRENYKQLKDSFKDLLTETVGQIKRANEYSAEQQMKEIEKIKSNEPHKFKRKANEDQFQRIDSEELRARKRTRPVRRKPLFRLSTKDPRQ